MGSKRDAANRPDHEDADRALLPARAMPGLFGKKIDPWRWPRAVARGLYVLASLRPTAKLARAAEPGAARRTLPRGSGRRSPRGSRDAHPASASRSARETLPGNIPLGMRQRSVSGRGHGAQTGYSLILGEATPWRVDPVALGTSSGALLMGLSRTRSLRDDLSSPRTS